MYKLEIKKGGTYSNLRSPPLHVGGDGFEPPKRDAADLQSAPFGHSGNHPFVFNPTLWVSLLSDSNQRPRDYKSRALAN